MGAKCKLELRKALSEYLTEEDTGELCLMSIKPIYSERIFQGVKRVEYRLKSIKPNVKKVFVYETLLKKSLVGFFEIDSILKDSPFNIWEKTFLDGGIQEKSFLEYCQNRNSIYAIKIAKPYKFPIAINPYDISNFLPPQSFYYF